jgi:hypothetical protein
VAIIGSRTYPTKTDVTAYVFGLAPGTVIVSGGATGPGAWAVEAAEKRGLAVAVHLPDKDRDGASALYRRNVRLVEDADRVVAFAARDEKTKAITAGTTMAIDMARRAGLPVEVVETPVSPKLCLLIFRARRAIENAAAASDAASVARRVRHAQRALAALQAGIDRLAERMHAGWFHADALPQDDPRIPGYHEKTVMWIAGYARACDAAEQIRWRHGALRQRSAAA